MQTPYHYQAINVDEIRLLRLRPGDSKILEGELVTCRYDDEVLDGDAASAFIVRGRDVRVVDEGDYDAISYYWGAGEPTTHITIYHSEVQEEVVGHIPLKPSLEMALKTFRALLDPQKIKFFWIDAICIDQQNKAEKSAQIRRMAVIYNQADIVRVWLGEDSSKSDIAMDFVGDLVNLNNIDELSSQMNHKWAAFRDLLRREWFNRRWILQEIALARRALVYCGKKSVEWETFAYAVSLFTAKSAQLKRLFMASPDHNFDPDYLGELNALGAKILIDVTNNMFRKHDNGDIEEHLVSLEGLMSLLSMFEASNPHDTIYAILWLAYDATPGAARPAAIYPGVARSPMASPRVTSRAHHRPDDSIDIRIDLVPSLKITDAGSMTSSPTDMHFNALSPNQNNGSGRPRSSRESTEAHQSIYLFPQSTHRGRDRSGSLSAKRSDSGEAQAPKPIEVDYDKTVFEVCKDFLEFVIARSRSLDIICRPWAPSPPDKQEQDLPTWVPHNSGRAFELTPTTMVYKRTRADSLVGTPGAGNRPYNACGRYRAHNTDNSRPFIVDRTLLVKGFVLDTVEQIEDKASHGIIPSSWLDLVGCSDAGDPIPSLFWRTLVANRDLDSHSPPPGYFSLACKWAMGCRTPNYDLNTMSLLDRRCPEPCANFLQRVLAVIWDRRLGLTKGTDKTDSLLGLLPRTAQSGDLICILYGCSVPVVLRRHEPRKRISANNKMKTPKPERGTKSTLYRGSTLPADTAQTRTAATELQQPNTPTSASPQKRKFTDECEQTVTPVSPLVVETSFPQFDPSSSAPVDSQPPQTQLTNPLIPLDKRYEFIGECYVHGMMSGEAFKHQRKTRNEVQEFWLV